MNYTLIILGAIVIILLYVLYKYYFASNTLAKQLSLATTNSPIAISNQSNAQNFNYGLWLYVNSWDTNNTKLIFRDADSNANAKLALFLEQNSPTLDLFIRTTTSTTLINITKNFPVQSWCYIAVNVNKNYVDCYLNGKLIKSVFLSNLPTFNVTQLTVGGGSNKVDGLDSGNAVAIGTSGTPQAFDATITSFIRSPTIVSPQDVWNTYLAGNGMSGLIPAYGVNIDLTKNNQVANSYTII